MARSVPAASALHAAGAPVQDTVAASVCQAAADNDAVFIEMLTQVGIQLTLQVQPASLLMSSALRCAYGATVFVAHHTMHLDLAGLQAKQSVGSLREASSSRLKMSNESCVTHVVAGCLGALCCTHCCIEWHPARPGVHHGEAETRDQSGAIARLWLIARCSAWPMSCRTLLQAQYICVTMHHNALSCGTMHV